MRGTYASKPGIPPVRANHPTLRVLSVAAVIALASLTRTAPAAEFVRGDVNGDGQVSYSDDATARLLLGLAASAPAAGFFTRIIAPR